MYVSTSPLCVAVRVRSISFAFVGFTVVVIFLCPWTEYRTLENKDCCWECGGDVQMWWGCSNIWEKRKQKLQIRRNRGQQCQGIRAKIRFRILFFSPLLLFVYIINRQSDHFPCCFICFAPNVISMFESSKIRLSCYFARMVEKRNKNKNLVRKRQVGRRGMDGKVI